MNNRFTRILLGVSLIAALIVTGLVMSPKLARADASGNIYNLYAFGLQQLTGSPGPGTVVQPTYAAAITIGTNQDNQGLVMQINANSTTSSTSTLTPGNGGQFGQMMITIISATGPGTATITFASPFKPTATAAPTTGTSITVMWVSDGNFWREMGRSASAQ